MSKRIHFLLAATIASMAVYNSALAATINGFTVTAETVPTCNVYVPAPTAATNTVTICDATSVGNVCQTAAEDPWYNYPTQTGIQPTNNGVYVSVEQGGGALRTLRRHR